MPTVDQILTFFGHPIFNVIGGISFLIAFITIVYKTICFFWGITPLVLRLGIAMWKRKVAIFANEENFNSLKSLLIDSGIFKEANIDRVFLNDLDKAKSVDIYLVDWSSSKEHIQEIFECRPNNQTPVIIFAAPKTIDDETMKVVANKSNTVIVNFKGRLMNDLLTSLVTTSYDKP